MTIIDCVKAISKACKLGHFNFQTFSLPTFNHLLCIENGDISWIIPGKFIAFSGPVSERRELSPGVYTLLPEEYVPIFHQLGVTCVIRFNKKCYDKTVFTRNGIKHIDLYHEDGSNPTDAILHFFLKACENESGVIAVHCKAGLGRTGTNIAAYMMKHYMYTAREAIAWCRICRPGSIVGPQQQYLESIQDKMWSEGNKYRQGANNLGGKSKHSQQSNESERVTKSYIQQIERLLATISLEQKAINESSSQNFTFVNTNGRSSLNGSQQRPLTSGGSLNGSQQRPLTSGGTLNNRGNSNNGAHQDNIGSNLSKSLNFSSFNLNQKTQQSKSSYPAINYQNTDSDKQRPRTSSKDSSGSNKKFNGLGLRSINNSSNSSRKTAQVWTATCSGSGHINEDVSNNFLTIQQKTSKRK